MKELVEEHRDKDEWPELWRSSEEINREEEKSKFGDGRVERTFTTHIETTFFC